LAGVDTGPVRLEDVGGSLVGQRPDTALFAAAAEIAGTVAGIEDVHASQGYRRHLAVIYTRRALVLAYERAVKEKSS